MLSTVSELALRVQEKGGLQMSNIVNKSWLVHNGENSMQFGWL